MTRDKSLWFIFLGLLIFTGIRDYKRTQLIAAPVSFVVQENTTEPQSHRATEPQSHRATEPLFSREFVPASTAVPRVHAVTAAFINKRFIEVMWFGGSTEGAKDVAIYANRLDIAAQRWSGSRVVLTRAGLMQQSGFYIKKLGNPVLYYDANGNTHLFVVGASMGGWATARIFHLTAAAGSDEYLLRQVLPLSPLLNISYLVRTSPVSLSDGGFYLPIYQELAYTQGLILRFDRQGHFIARQKPNRVLNQLQPSLAVLNEKDCISAWRSKITHRPMMVQYCRDAGRTWLPPQWANLDNNDSSVVIFPYREKIWLIYNQSQGKNNRYFLTISRLSHIGGANFAPSKLLDKTENNIEVSYPAVLVVNDVVHIFYTYDRKKIKHLQINNAWLEDMP